MNNLKNNRIEIVDDEITESVDIDNTTENVVDVIGKKEKQPISFIVDIESKAIVESITETLENFSVDKLMDILPRLISHVENYKNLSGLEKKNLVIRMLNHIIDITDCPGDDDIWDPIIKRLVPNIIDSMIKVENKKLKLRKKKKYCGFFFRCME